ncbi:large subunit ribosomal protein L28 [Fusobacterium naviforme]|uniref:Large ribosomal subunit protein bL28 n=1 Tax=Moryella indoligenes TaxID=371674 RepID=A0AAE3V911_9FIRM|nr:50S ribosomal protein L28 [Moryella indoligenes]KAB0578754.1 50S ribosomal protein L28 [Fusobacterium naviforme]MDQ0151997.1 large subunit ribosomal protein L28 [Moryella indoligenes]PSL11523.1 large subunit ribosomal protein L28 [Fusobacterium naviforme]STO26604.1 50S ribosomal protein L28 [Fusobacterium naviforme]
MAKCAITGKTTVFGNNVSHSHRRTNKQMKANLKKVRAIVNGTPKRIWVSTRALRSGWVERA